MVRYFWLFVVAITAVTTGCRNHCCYRKGGCTSCAPPGPIVGQSFAAPAPATITQPAPEVLMPSNAPPPPRTSGFAPTPPASNQPAVTLQSPEFSEAGMNAPRASEASRTAGAVPSNIRAVVAGKLFTGHKPTLDDIDRLASAGVKQIACVNETGSVVDSKVFESRGIEVTTIRNGPDALGELNVLRNRGPVFVYSDDTETLRSFWTRYYREVELLSADASRIVADAMTMN